MYSGAHTLLNTIFLCLGAFLAFNAGNWKARPWFACMLLALALSDLILVFSLLAFGLDYPVSDMMSFDIWAGGRSIGYLVIFAAFWETLDEAARKRLQIPAWFIIALIILTGLFRQIDMHLAIRAFAAQFNHPVANYLGRVVLYLAPRLPLFILCALHLRGAFSERNPERMAITLYATFELAGDIFKMVVTDFLHLRIFEFRADPWFRTLLALGAIIALVYRSFRHGEKVSAS